MDFVERGFSEEYVWYRQWLYGDVDITAWRDVLRVIAQELRVKYRKDANG